MLNPKLVYKEALQILGLQELFTPENEDFEGIWKRFMNYHGHINSYSGDGAYYGVNFVGEEHVSMDYLAGMLVADLDEVPEGLTLRKIPASCYVVFECTVKEISNTYD